MDDPVPICTTTTITTTTTTIHLIHTFPPSPQFPPAPSCPSPSTPSTARSSAGRGPTPSAPSAPRCATAASSSSGPFCLSQLAECVYQFVVLYTQKRFGWGYVMLGLYISATGIFLALVQGNLRFIVPRYVSQNGCVTVGLMGHAVGMYVLLRAAAVCVLYIFHQPTLSTTHRHTHPGA